MNLDIVRPDTTEKKLPVIVYIHGGNNQTGHAQEIKGNTFVKDVNAVYVSVNYRLGALGFNPLKALKTGNELENSGNFTLLDIAKALDWIQQNIEVFGGDKNNVTLAGFSAGGRDVMATLISPLFKGKYHKAISFSGGMTLADENTSQEVFAKAIAPLVVEDGVRDNFDSAVSWLLSDDSKVRDYLYQLPAERLAKLMGNAGIRMAVFPHLYVDGHVIPKTKFESSSYNDVPLMLVTGTNEFSLFTAFDPYFVKDFSSGTLFTDTNKLAEFKYTKKYGGQLYRLSNTVDSTRIMAGKYNSDIYVAQILYGDNSQITPDLTKTLGSFHGVFEPLLQSSSNYEKLIGDTFNNDGAKLLSAQFKQYIKQFVHTGNPNGNDNVKWTKWSSDKQEVLQLDATTEKSIIQMSSDTDTPSNVIDRMKKDTTITDSQKKTLHEKVLNGRWFSQPIDTTNFDYK